MNEKIRTFIAIDLVSPIKELTKYIQGELKRTECSVKWVKPENTHITLKFLGNVEQTLLPKIKGRLSDVTSSIRVNSFTTTTLGAFPNPKFPKIIWLGIKEDGTITQLFQSIEDAMFTLKFNRESRSFSAHITLGRVTTTKNLGLLTRAIMDFPAPSVIDQTVNAVTLFKSTLTPQGPVYESLSEFPLQYTDHA